MLCSYKERASVGWYVAGPENILFVNHWGFFFFEKDQI